MDNNKTKILVAALVALVVAVIGSVSRDALVIISGVCAAVGATIGIFRWIS